MGDEVRRGERGIPCHSGSSGGGADASGSSTSSGGHASGSSSGGAEGGSAESGSGPACLGHRLGHDDRRPGQRQRIDAAGLPITPLLLRGDELIGAGAIDHALRFTCAASEQGHIAPARASASSSAGSGVPANPHDLTFPPMGMRVRLKASYDPTAHSFPAPIVAILKAIQKYGLLLADNGGNNSRLRTRFPRPPRRAFCRHSRRRRQQRRNRRGLPR